MVARPRSEGSLAAWNDDQIALLSTLLRPAGHPRAWKSTPCRPRLCVNYRMDVHLIALGRKRTIAAWPSPRPATRHGVLTKLYCTVAGVRASCAPSAQLLGKPDDDAFRPADVGEPVRVSVLHLADEFGAVGLHVRYDSIYFVDSKHEAAQA